VAEFTLWNRSTNTKVEGQNGKGTTAKRKSRDWWLVVGGWRSRELGSPATSNQLPTMFLVLPFHLASNLKTPGLTEGL
jgi:hypothetical protein